MKSLCTLFLGIVALSLAAATTAMPGDPPVENVVMDDQVVYVDSEPMDLISALYFMERETGASFSVTTIVWFACDGSDSFEVVLSCSRTNTCFWPEASRWKQGSQTGCPTPYVGGVFPCTDGQNCQTVVYSTQQYEDAVCNFPCDFMSCPPKKEPTACCE